MHAATNNAEEVPESVGGFHGTTDNNHNRHQQQQNTPLMGIAHRHDEALSHNPTPSETLMERRDNGHKEEDTEPLITGTLGASPARSAVDGGIGGADGTSHMPRTILFPESLYGEAAEPARLAPQSAATPSTPRKTYGTEEGLMPPPPPPTSSPSSTRSPSGSARSSQRKRVNSDGSNNSTLVEMLMKSSPARALRPRVGSSSELMDERVLHVAEHVNTEVDDHDEEPNGDGIDNDESDSDGCAKKHANLSSRYDYDASWNMAGHHHHEAAVTTVATSTTSQTSGVLSEAVAASAAVAAAVNNSDIRPITPSDLVLSSSATASDGHSHSTPQSASPASASHSSRQRRPTRPLAESRSSLPSSPIHLIPRRRTQSTPNAGSAYIAPSPHQNSSRKRRAYAYHKYNTGEGLQGADSVDLSDEFDDVRNISPSASNGNDEAEENPFDDFDGAPVCPRVGTGLDREESVRSVSTSSSSSVTHRRRRPGGQVDPSGTTIFGGHSAASVSSFSGSVSTTTGVSLHPPTQVRTFHHNDSLTRAGENFRTNTSNEIVETNPAARSLRASLDAGMAAISRWARSHAGVAGSAAASAAQAGGHGPPRSSRAATMQLGEEDLFALANAGADPRRSVSALEEEQRLGGVGSHGLGGLSGFAPIAEEEEGTGAGGRNRAFSEPDRARVRNFFTRRAANNRGGSPPQRSNQSRLFGTTSGTAQIGGDVISHLSSSTDIASGARTLSTAAMSSSLFHSSSMPPQAAARVISANANRNADDQIDLIERGSATNDDSMEDVLDDSSRREANGISRENVMVSSSNSDDRGESGDEGNDEDREPRPPTTRADLDRRARRRWVRINQRFQVLITFVALIFSLILFAVLVTWIVMTSSYVVSIDKPCDVPLKKYFWLATLQLVFDVFRTDIMRHILRWDPNQGQRIPKRVVIYNMAYLIYAICVLRLGVKSVYFSPESTCPDSAPEFYSAAAAFVTLSLAAWSTIVVGYLFPFCFVAIILTRNGYSPSADIEGGEEAINAAIPGVFPNYHANSGAPPGCIDRLQVIMLHEFPDDYPRECCICMSDFSEGEVIVVTNCEHVFHKRCCQEWLQQARTCPVCRTDIPTALGMSEHGSDDGSWDGDPSRPRPNRPPLNREEFHQEVVSLLRLLRQHEERLRDRLAHPEDEREDEIDADQRSEGTASDNISLPRSSYANRSGDLEEGRMEQEESASLPSYRSRRSQ